MLSIFSKKDFFTEDEKKQIVEGIRTAEQKTSGEIRVFVESRCRYVDPLDRASEIFLNLKMALTADRNSVLIYLAVKDRQFAIYADKGIHEKLGEVFWKNQVDSMTVHFRQQNFKNAIVGVIGDIGTALFTHFPFNRETDKNELPDDIVFGKG